MDTAPQGACCLGNLSRGAFGRQFGKRRFDQPKYGADFHLIPLRQRLTWW